MSLSDPRKVLEATFVRVLDPRHVDVRGEYLDRLESEGFPFLEVHLASLPRRIGRELVPEGGVVVVGSGRVDLSAWRVCDLCAADLLVRLPPNENLLKRLYFQGDAEERRMVLRSLPFVDDDRDAVTRLLEEAHRTNDESIFESALLDSDVAARVLDTDAWNRVVLKCAFLGLPKERLLGWETRGNPALSGMLFDFMTEREAAGRAPWIDTAPLCNLAPEGLRERARSESDPGLRDGLRRLLLAIEAVSSVH